jgi:hypothetical protein
MSAPLLADILRAAEWRVELHSKHFPTRGNIPDHEWVPIAAAKECAIITSDKKIRGWRTENGLVRPVIMECRAKIFFLRGEDLDLDDQAFAIGKARVAICRHFRQHAGTFMIARIHSKGPRLGEVQILEAGEATKTKKKYGAERSTA